VQDVERGREQREHDERAQNLLLHVVVVSVDERARGRNARSRMPRVKRAFFCPRAANGFVRSRSRRASRKVVDTT
jgi:hypothetical protein